MGLPFIRKTRDIAPELKLLVDATSQMERGTFVSHEDITKISGIAKDAPEHYKLIHKWKRAMRQVGLWVKAATPLGTGYKILTLDEQRIYEPIRLQKQAMRRIDMAAACVGSIPEEALDETSHAYQQAVLHQLAGMKKQHQKNQAQLASYLANPKTLPRATERLIEK